MEPLTWGPKINSFHPKDWKTNKQEYTPAIIFFLIKQTHLAPFTIWFNTHFSVFPGLAVARMTRQLTVPKCDGPILLLLDVLTCSVGTLALKAPGSGGLLPLHLCSQLLCRHAIDPAPPDTECPVVCSSRSHGCVHGWYIPQLSHRTQRGPGTRGTKPSCHDRRLCTTGLFTPSVLRQR